MSIKFDTNAEYILENESVLLRPLRTDDIEHLLPFAINEPDTWKYSHGNGAGKDGMTSYIHNALAAKNEGREYPFIVFDKKTGTYAGSTRFYDLQLLNQCVQLGHTWYGKKFRGTGLNKHCKFLLLQFAFEDLDMERVEFRADARNQRSIAAMKSIGCTVEGIIRSHIPLRDGTRRDSIILSILKSEWYNTVKGLLISKLK
jgi:RimJ/RimL family protein N-acetyltransferase